MKKHQYSKTRRLQKGASLLEGIAYLGIAAIVVIGAIALLNTAFSSSNANDVNSQLSAIQTATRKLFMTTQGSYGTTDITQTLITAKAFPQTLSVGASTVRAPWNGGVKVSGAASGQQFTITYTSLPADLCVNAMTATSNGWVSVTGPADKAAHTPPISPADAQTSCGSSAGDVVWTSN
ncbi:type 4 pilus major pilin [Trinickia sp. NRRL B-1857]|uniref:type 4 pilus major pilin n=1 Tax=Trinickia sp. NRRL B-1857 TaxID=3162879 RepID=UPI003D2C3746